MLAKKFLYFLLITSAVLSCKKDVAPSKSDLLTAKTTKSWIIIKRTPENPRLDASCRISSIQHSDNFWFFTAGGAFEYNNGIILEDPNCHGSCCSDFSNVYGKWSLYKGETKLKVHIVGKIEKGVKTELSVDQQIDFLDVTISTLTSTQLIVTEDDNTILEYAAH